jgi:hypothetical protein
MSEPARAVEAAVRAYVLTMLSMQRRRPTPLEVATFRANVSRSFGVPVSAPPPPRQAPDPVDSGGAAVDGACNDEPTRPLGSRARHR